MDDSTFLSIMGFSSMSIVIILCNLLDSPYNGTNIFSILVFSLIGLFSVAASLIVNKDKSFRANNNGR